MPEAAKQEDLKFRVLPCTLNFILYNVIFNSDESNLKNRFLWGCTVEPWTLPVPNIDGEKRNLYPSKTKIALKPYHLGPHMRTAASRESTMLVHIFICRNGILGSRERGDAQRTEET